MGIGPEKIFFGLDGEPQYLPKVWEFCQIRMWRDWMCCHSHRDGLSFGAYLRPSEKGAFFGSQRFSAFRRCTLTYLRHLRQLASVHGEGDEVRHHPGPLMASRGPGWP